MVRSLTCKTDFEESTTLKQNHLVMARLILFSVTGGVRVIVVAGVCEVGSLLKTYMYAIMYA